MRAALFVDFDNMGISFAELDETAAQRFATQPGRWLSWFESGAHAARDGEPLERRRILLRRCYLNPVTFGRYRADYTRAAFTVVDCPPLTQRGKTSADVYMVMDILDALGRHGTTFDEFIILSADADFTPVLLRLREHDRRTTIIATNVAAAAYKAACDNVVPYERFFEEALGIESEPLVLPATADWAEAGAFGYGSLLPEVARTLRDRVATGGALTAREMPGVFASFPEFRNSSWFGCLSLKALMARLLALEPALAMHGDPNAAWTVTLREGGERAPAAATPAAAAPAPAGPALAGRIVEEVRRLLAEAERPVPMASAAHRITAALGPAARDSQWAGHGTFKALLLAADAPDIAVLPVQPGYVYDPARHDVAALAGAAGGGGTEGEDEGDPFEGVPLALAAFARRVAGVTGAPALSPAAHAVLFRAVAEAAAAQPAGASANVAELSRAVRDLCQARGARVARSQVNFVLTGFRYHEVDPAALSPRELARAWADNVRDLCRNAQLTLTAGEEDLIDAWIAGGLGEPAAPAAEPAPAAGEEEAAA
jgi:hypothetical protein